MKRISMRGRRGLKQGQQSGFIQDRDYKFARLVELGAGFLSTHGRAGLHNNAHKVAFAKDADGLTPGNKLLGFNVL